ncbi:hypothetical protein GCM10027347_52430 [Larkinella harenae]
MTDDNEELPDESSAALTEEKPWDFGLNEKQRAFVIQWCEHRNGAKAARLAGYSPNSDDEIAYENLRKPQIIAAINAYLSAFYMTVGEATSRISDYARGTMAHFLKIDESNRVTINLNHPDAKEYYHLIKKIKQRVITRTSEESVTEEVWTEIELHDSMAASKLMLELHGRIIQRTDHTSGGKPIPTQHKVIFEDYTEQQ